ncbi:hypothetical protein TanjilG_21432 [Lupinus angustifolius]|uniref:Peroxidase n=1 Tax=Lupinus angustifolius TaxID=3871 RepID=A0A4P1RNE0_LUPAN|nr:hypothetical protein TanjilG_21432 [Lupinus angustifolius]
MNQVVAATSQKTIAYDAMPTLKVEPQEEGFMIKVLSQRSCRGLLVFILEAFEELGLDVLQARVSCEDHFCLEALGIKGCDASVLLDDTSSFTGEKTAAANVNSLRGFDVIDDIKTKLETACPGIVSCADILAVAARDSVVALGGQSWSVGLGRRDSTTASKDAATTDIPSPLMDLSDLISAFSTKGFTTQEMVALTGAHTIGQARCQLFRGRIYNETNIDSDFATSVKSKCPSSGGDSNLTSLDVTTNELFDNAYFKNLVNKKGLLHSDQQLFSGGSTDSQVTTYSTSPSTFYADFSTVMVKMGNLSILTGQSGQIRTNCRNVN